MKESNVINIEVKVDTTELDEAIEKLEKANSLVGELASKKKISNKVYKAYSQPLNDATKIRNPY